MNSKDATGTYYLGRVIKLGILNEHQILDAILRPATVVCRGNAWTIIDASLRKDNNHQFGYGRLCKFAPETEVPVIDLMKKAQVSQAERNVILASSPFVYIPEHSGIAFLRVPGHIEPNVFTRRFCSVITETYTGFFVECHIEPIADLRTFAIKLAKLQGIHEIHAKVFPPNPLFGPLWKSLHDYILARNTDSMKIQEDSPHGEFLNTELPKHVQCVADEEQAHVPKEPLPIGDAAILMAADGYGEGIVRGHSGNRVITIRTSETIRNFAFEKNPDPYELYVEAKAIFERIKEERHMDHGGK